MASSYVDAGGRRLAIRNLDRVIFPQTGTTKAELLDYYARVADTMLAHLRDRLLHMHRYPEGVDGPRLWQKECPESRPDSVTTAPVWSRDKRADIRYCVVEELATLLWAVNIGSLELHTSLHRRDALDRPTALAFDLDPGPGAGMLECCAVALRVRDLFAGLGLRSCAKTSGGKGLQVYVPLNTPVTYAEAKPAARTDGGRGARGGDAGSRRLADGALAARGQGARRLKPEHRAQVDGVRVLGPRAGAADGVDAGGVGRAAGGAGSRRCGRARLREGRRPRADRAPRRPVRTGPDRAPGAARQRLSARAGTSPRGGQRTSEAATSSRWLRDAASLEAVAGAVGATGSAAVAVGRWAGATGTTRG